MDVVGPVLAAGTQRHPATGGAAPTGQPAAGDPHQVRQTELDHLPGPHVDDLMVGEPGDDVVVQPVQGHLDPVADHDPSDVSGHRDRAEAGDIDVGRVTTPHAGQHPRDVLL